MKLALRRVLYGVLGLSGGVGGNSGQLRGSWVPSNLATPFCDDFGICKARNGAEDWNFRVARDFGENSNLER